MKLQSMVLDVVEAYRKIDEVKQFYKEIQTNRDAEFHKVYAQSEMLGAAVNVEPCKPRNWSRQCHRANAEAESIGVVSEEWSYSICGPHSNRTWYTISVLSQTSSQLLELVPSVQCSKKDFGLSTVERLYAQDLPSPELLLRELTRWKYMHILEPESKIATTCAKAIKECDKVIFPNLLILLQIACTLPVTSRECKRSASTLHHLCNFITCKYVRDQTVFTCINSHSLPACSWSCCCFYHVCRVASKKNAARKCSVRNTFRLVNFWYFYLPHVELSLSCSYIMYKCHIIACWLFEQFVAQHMCMSLCRTRRGVGAVGRNGTTFGARLVTGL